MRQNIQQQQQKQRQIQRRTVTVRQPVERIGKPISRMKVTDTTGNYLVIHGTVYKKLGTGQVIEKKKKQIKKKEESFL